MTPPRPVPSFLAPFVKLHEGFVSRAAPDPDGYGTIGYGHKLGPTDPLQGVTMDEVFASNLLNQDLDTEACFFCALSPGLTLAGLSDGQYAALIDFVFNEGIGQYRTSNLRRLVETKAWDQVPDELLKWKFGRGVVLPGLLARRHGECAMWAGRTPATP